MKFKFLALTMLLNIGVLYAQTEQKLTLTGEFSQLIYDADDGFENKYSFGTKLKENRAIGIYGEKESSWFTFWEASTGNLIVNRGKLQTLRGDIEIGDVGHEHKLSFRRNSDGAATASIGVVKDKELRISNATGYSYITFFTNGTENYKERVRISSSGNVGIGTIYPTAKLAVNGTIKAKEIKVTTSQSDWPDYVFADDYQLKDLAEVESFIAENKHLPEIPNAATMEEQGVSLGEMNKLLLQKVEELTLYIIQQEKRIAELEKSNSK